MRSLGVFVVLISLLSCAGRRPDHLGVAEGALAPCPASPNCVSSDAPADDAEHAVEPFRLTLPPEQAWQAAREAVQGLPRTRIASEGDGYLHAECRSAWLGFVDDLELHLRPEERIMAVRSASRLGWSDLGVNRKRVEGLRETLREREVLR